MKHLTILALGSRGDVFPNVVLGAALQQAGFQVRLITFENFAPLVNQFGLDFAAVPGDAEALLASGGGLALLESGQNILKQYQALRQTFWRLTDGITTLLSQPHLWQTDGIINQLPGSLYGRSLAEKLQIPLINVAVIPMLRTSAFPMVAFPNWPSFLPGYNTLTYRLAEQLVWSGFRQSVNQWRREVLGLAQRPFHGSFAELSHTPTLLGFSPHIVPRPADWGPNVHYTGYWLPEEPDWSPPDALGQFLAAGPPPILVSFGSMAVRDPQRLTTLVLQAAQLAGQRLILQSGWARLGQAGLTTCHRPFLPWITPPTAGCSPGWRQWSTTAAPAQPALAFGLASPLSSPRFYLTSSTGASAFRRLASDQRPSRKKRSRPKSWRQQWPRPSPTNRCATKRPSSAKKSGRRMGWQRPFASLSKSWANFLLLLPQAQFSRLTKCMFHTIMASC